MTDIEASRIESVVNAVADFADGASTGDLCRLTGLSIKQLKTVLLSMEEIGCVTRTGTKRGTSWHLG